MTTSTQSCRTCRWAEWDKIAGPFSKRGECRYLIPPAEILHVPTCVVIIKVRINPNDGANCPCWEEKTG